MRKILEALKKIDQKKILEYGLYLLVFLLPWQTRLFLRSGAINGDYSEYLTISLYGVDLLLIFLLLVSSAVFGSRILGGRHRSPGWEWLLLSLLEFIFFISIFQATDRPIAIYHYLIFLLGAGLFFLIRQVKYSSDKFFLSLWFSACIQAILAIAQFIAQRTWAWKWLGLASHRPAELGVVVVESGGERWLRAYGGFDHPNVLGGFLALVLILVWSLWMKWVGESKKFKILFHFSEILIATALFFSFSRSAWLALLVGAMPILFYVFKKKPGAKEILISLGVIFLTMGFWGWQYQDLLRTRATVSGRLEEKSVNERKESWKQAKEIAQANFWGVGAGNYVLALREQIPDRPAWFYQPTHNVFLLVLAELGFFGFLVYLIFLVRLFWQGLKEKSFFTLATISALLVIFCFDHWLFSSHFGFIFFWIILGIVYKNLSNSFEKNKKDDFKPENKG